MLKGPTEELDYAVDWSDWLAGESDTEASVAWAVPAGLTQISTNFVNGKALIRLSGGTDGADYAVPCTLTTTGGEIAVRTLRITVRQR